MYCEQMRLSAWDGVCRARSHTFVILSTEHMKTEVRSHLWWPNACVHQETRDEVMLFTHFSTWVINYSSNMDKLKKWCLRSQGFSQFFDDQHFHSYHLHAEEQLPMTYKTFMPQRQTGRWEGEKHPKIMVNLWRARSPECHKPALLWKNTVGNRRKKQLFKWKMIHLSIDRCFHTKQRVYWIGQVLIRWRRWF